MSLSLKFLVIGDENVGKTTIVNYFTLVPVKMATSTVGIDFQTRMVALSSDMDGGGEEPNKNTKEQKNNFTFPAKKNFQDFPPIFPD